jgi:hypothetical protein
MDVPPCLSNSHTADPALAEGEVPKLKALKNDAWLSALDKVKKLRKIASSAGDKVMPRRRWDS